MTDLLRATRADPAPIDLGPADPVGALALAVLATLPHRRGPVLFVAASTARAEAVAAILSAAAPGLGVALFPPWDCLPYDRVAPSRAVVGRRAGVLRWLAEGAPAPDVVVATPAGLIQKLPPPRIWREARLEFRVGDRLDLARTEAALARLGYGADDRVDEPGEYALRGRVVDLFPAAAPRPCRIEHEGGVIGAIRSYDPASQRSVVETDLLVVDAATEAILTEEARAALGHGRPLEHRLAEVYPDLAALLDYLPAAPVLLDAGAEAAAAAFFDQIEDAGDGRPARSGDVGLYAGRDAWRAGVDEHLAGAARPAESAERAVPLFAAERDPARALRGFVAARRAAGERIVLAGRGAASLAHLIRRLDGPETPAAAADWAAVEAAAPGSLLALALPVDAGFRLAAAAITVIAAADLGAEEAPAEAVPTGAAFGFDDSLHPHDTVVHLDHGLAELEGLETVEDAGGEPVEAVRLRFADDDRLLVPVDEIGRLWRYGAEPGEVSLARLGGEAWLRTRRAVEAEIAAAAEATVALARARAARTAPVLVPPAEPFGRLAGRFPYPPTPDQAAAIAAVLADLASGRPMDRLVCGDVGFGKTEVAIRAAGAAALAGRQVAIVAPTTVLVRQHLETFRRRFAGLGITIAHLSRLVKPAEARKVAAGLADGSIRIVIGTHALAGPRLRFRDLGLVVIDEEQRFGVRHKERLRALAADIHVLTMTATPIPRTLQAAMIGLQDLSVIATPPVARLPVRTVVAAFDDATVRGALLREHRRGGQSFVVCPRIEDIAPMARRLAELVPDLALRVAHGRMPAEDIDEITVGFAGGDGDVLLATNIIESGLDVPNANTILVWRADRFGLAQLHQLRGRVGRGNRRGTAYLLTDPAAPPGPTAGRRLAALEGFDRLGSGFAVSARDLDIRGAGDMVGEEQAGHLRVIGIALYRHLTERALAAARGQAVEPDWRPELRLGMAGRVPEDYVPDEEVRLDLYVRLDRLESEAAIEAFEDELDDRFGPPPPPLARLMLAARIRVLCRALGIARLEAGPKAAAATFRGRPPLAKVAGTRWKDDRMILPLAEDDPEARARALFGWLERFAAD